ncbi:MAG: T9SS type A sorting domain-containing protein [Hymenobacter sp.]|nr:MAG: T9SS type A sorting domain-containing protein [Hymenobacter sp.]
MAVYPNPTAGQRIQVVATNLATTGGTVQLFDALGRLVLTQAAAAGTAEALIEPAHALASGLYFVTWQTADGVKLTTKVVVQ